MVDGVVSMIVLVGVVDVYVVVVGEFDLVGVLDL